MNKKIKKIVHIVSYFPPHLGGMENCAFILSKKTAEKGYSVKVFTSDIGSEKNKIKSIRNYQINYLKSGEFAHTPLIYSLLFKLLKLDKNSIIHLHVSQAISPETVFLVSKIKRIPYVAHIHMDVDPSGPMGFLLIPYKKIFLKPVLHGASKIVCLSELQKKVIAEKYNISEDKISVIPNGVGEEYFYNRTDIKKKKIPTILFVGRLAPQKNVPRLLHAIKLLDNKVNLQIVGDGEEKNAITNLINELNLKNVSLFGKKTGKDLINLYQHADILVMPSNKEGIPLVLMEAMAAGLPIIASNIAGVNETLGDAGILVKKLTPEEFAKAIDNLINKPQLQLELSKKAFRKAKKITWTKITNDFEEIYSQI